MVVVMKQIILQRKRKELDPMIKLLNDISDVECQCKESEEFCRNFHVPGIQDFKN